ncbi:hypothetical protein ACX0MV_07800 [Pseudomonas borbori]
MNKQNGIEAESHKSSETLEREIDQKLSNIDGIVDALEAKLDPSQLINKAVSFGKDNGREFVDNLSASISANPISSVLTAVGLLGLILGSRNQSSTSGSSLSSGVGKAKSVAHGVSESLSHATSSAAGLASKVKNMTRQGSTAIKSRAHDLSDSLSSVANDARQAKQRIREQAHDLQDNMTRVVVERPLLTVAAGVALGALLGAALPAVVAKKKAASNHNGVEPTVVVPPQSTPVSRYN